jgi:hypothetical protein
MPDYRFIIEDGSGKLPQSVPGGLPPGNVPGDKPLGDAPGNTGATFSDGFAKNLTNSMVSRAVVSPLNGVTGGFAAPALQVGKALINGAGGAALGGAVAGAAVAVVAIAIQKFEEYYNKRVAENQAQAYAANEKDNTLIRAGSKTYVTEYTSDFWGVRSTNRT